jgi:hypothetical protein
LGKYTRGGVYQEEEEIEDNPELKKMKDLQDRLHMEESRLEGICCDTASKLQIKYDGIVGVKSDLTKPLKLVNFWADQILIYDIYQKTVPMLLAEKSGQDYKEIDIGFRTI